MYANICREKNVEAAPAFEVLGTLIDHRAKAATPAGSGFASMYSDGGLVGVIGTGKSAEAGALTHSLAACVKVKSRAVATVVSCHTSCSQDAFFFFFRIHAGRVLR